MTEGLRWQITKAVRASDLPAPAKLVMLVLADVAEVGTAEIPEKFTPSLRVLARETGLGEATVKRHLKALVDAGWIERTVPDGKAQGRMERTRYRLLLPGLSTDRGSERTGVQSEPPRGSERSGPGLTVIPTGAQSEPPDTDHPDQGQTEDRSLVLPRADVEHICRHLAARIEGNGSKRPNVTKRWRDSARLLLDRDGRTVEQVVKAIDWCQTDTFWRANILSMPTLREKYDQLRLAAQRKNGTNGHKPSTTDQRVAAAMALAEKFAEKETT